MTDPNAFENRDLDKARNRVQLPGVFLIIVGIINLIVLSMALFSSVQTLLMDENELKASVAEQWKMMEAMFPDMKKQLEDAGWTPEKLEKQQRSFAPVYAAVTTVLALFALLSIIGGWRMTKLRSRGLAITGSALMTIPLISPLGCCLVGEVVGIWCLVVLLNPDVAAAFADRANPSPPDLDRP
jgi:hypothetical protein